MLINSLKPAYRKKQKQKGLIRNGLAKISVILITNFRAYFGLHLVFGTNLAKIRLRFDGEN